MKAIFYPFILIFIIMISCNDDQINLENEKKQLIETDKSFSKLSEKEGMIKAFLKYSDEDAVILKNKSHPIKGKQEIGKSYTGTDDSKFILTWEPLHASVSKSLDLAYTYGIYSLMLKNDKSVTKGTYVSIWKKQEDKSWKWVLDSGNEGLE